MRATITIDDRLMARAMRASGAATKREAVERGLELLLTLGGQSMRPDSGAERWAVDANEETGTGFAGAKLSEVLRLRSRCSLRSG